MISKTTRLYPAGNRLAHSLAIPGLDLDIDLHDDINIYDFVPNTVSAFAQLLMEKENMKAWNDFLAKTDEEQDEFLRQNSHLDDEWDNFDGEPGIQRQTGSGRKGSCHPAFSPELSFARIDKDLRNFLQEKRRLPFVSILWWTSSRTPCLEASIFEGVTDLLLITPLLLFL